LAPPKGVSLNTVNCSCKLGPYSDLDVMQHLVLDLPDKFAVAGSKKNWPTFRALAYVSMQRLPPFVCLRAGQTSIALWKRKQYVGLSATSIRTHEKHQRLSDKCERVSARFLIFITPCFPVYNKIPCSTNSSIM